VSGLENILEIKQLNGGYSRRRPVLHDVSFQVKRGEIVGLIGLNGAGKSTTIKHTLGLLEPFSGEILVAGKKYTESKDTYRKQIAFIPETPILYDELTLWEHMELTASSYEIMPSLFKERGEQLLEEFNMTKMKKWFPNEFSKGMRQKVMIMCAFLVTPPLFVVDEPFVGLDPLGIRSFLDYLTTAKNNGAGVLMSTHILSTAEKQCDRFIILHNGKVRMTGTLQELQTQIGMRDATLDDIYVAVTKEKDNEE
jgi:ABC-2 type transport system ATP-binding protein